MTRAPEAAATGDAEARRRALSPTESFIVQAPAGSGKTALLTQRTLSLLGGATVPEEILAITFTRKAAAEMQGRVLGALAAAAAGTPVTEPHEATTRALATAALARDAALGWNLLGDPGRLRIQTFDALNQWLAGRLPVLSGAGAAPAVCTDATPLYRRAARACVRRLEEPGPLAEALGVVLDWLDNDVGRLVALLAELLARRDHWLRTLGDTAFAAEPEAVRALLEAALEGVVGEGLEAVHAAFGAARRAELLKLLRLADEGWRLEPAARPAGASGAPVPDETDDLGTGPQALALWLRGATLLLTQGGDWRARLTRKEGFPPKAPEAKAAAEAFLDALSADDAARRALHALRSLPPPAYRDAQWAVVRAIVAVLGAAAQELELVFAAEGEVDFVAVSRQALAALGQEAQPSDFALRLDYRLRHVLVDEFQDTSAGQVALLERLTEGFVPGDGRTVFLVGDPMQSVYRFRAADVALFLKVRDQGLGDLPVTALVLQRNFRSQPALVDWVNETFARVFPPADVLRVGAVRHARAVAGRGAGPEGTARLALHPVAPDGEGEAVVRLIRERRDARPGARIAVLARTRNHLAPVARALAAAGIAYQGLDLVRLKDRLAVRDLIALTRAVCHLADRTAWLAVLRAPASGVSLADLEALVAGAPHRTVAELARHPEHLARLTEDGQARVTRTVDLLEAARADRGRRPLAACIEALWIALGCPATVGDDADLGNAQGFFARLESLERGGDLDDPLALEDELEALFAGPEPDAGEGLQLMTIHHAKGLEWDIVVLVGLADRARGDGARLLYWLDWERPDGEARLVLAPVAARAHGESDPLVDWIRSVESERAAHEGRRLWYVAATRAIDELHLVGTAVPPAANGEPATMPAGSALLLLAPALAAEWSRASAALVGAGDEGAAPASVARAPPEPRLARDWQPPPPEPRLPAPRDTPIEARPPEYLWVSEPARHAGTVVHEELARLADGEPGIDGTADESRLRARLRELGVEAAALEEALGRVVLALARTVAEPRGRWLLQAGHREARSEFALTGWDRGELVSVVIDRTFIDERGVRWVVDYKTSSHEGAGREAFLDSEVVRYRGQLERYARLMRAFDPAHRVEVGIYFPLLGGWRSWQPDEA